MVFNFIANNAGISLLSPSSVEIPFWIAILYFILIIKLCHFAFFHKEKQNFASIAIRAAIVGFLIYWPLGLFFAVFSLGLWVLRREEDKQKGMKETMDAEGITLLYGKDRSSDLFFTGSALIILLWKLSSNTLINNYLTNGISWLFPFWAQQVFGIFLVILALVIWNKSTGMKGELSSADLKLFIILFGLVILINGVDKAAMFLIGLFLLDMFFQFKNKHPISSQLREFKRQKTAVEKDLSAGKSNRYDQTLKNITKIHQDFEQKLEEKVEAVIKANRKSGITINREEIENNVRQADPELKKLNASLESKQKIIENILKKQQQVERGEIASQKAQRSFFESTLKPKDQGIPNPLVFIGYLGLFAVAKLFEHFYGRNLYTTLSMAQFSFASFLIIAFVILVKIFFVAFGRENAGNKSSISNFLLYFLIVEIVGSVIWWITTFTGFGVLSVIGITLMIYPLAIAILLSFVMALASGGFKGSIVTIGSVIFIVFIFSFIMISQNIHPTLLFFQTVESLPEPQQVAQDLDITIEETNVFGAISKWWEWFRDPTKALKEQQTRAQTESAPPESLSIKKITTSYNPKPKKGDSVQYSASLVAKNLRKEKCELNRDDPSCQIHVLCEMGSKVMDNKTLNKADVFETQEVYCNFKYPDLADVKRDRLTFKVISQFSATADVPLSFTDIPTTATVPKAISKATNINLNVILPPSPILVTKENDIYKMASQDSIKATMFISLSAQGKILDIKDSGLLVPEFLKIGSCHPFSFKEGNPEILDFTLPPGYKLYSIDTSSENYKSRKEKLNLPTSENIALSCDIAINEFTSGYTDSQYPIRAYVDYDFESSRMVSTGGSLI